MGQTKKAIYKVDNGTDFDIIHFETEDKMVKTQSGASTLDVDLAAKAVNGKVGKNSAASWTGNISPGTLVTITHNLGYNPIITCGGTMGNLTLTYNYLNYNQIQVYNFNGASNTFTGSVYMW